jgi:uncharacterized phage-associated protein
MLGFNYKKAVQSLNFFAISEEGSINKMKALKLIWLSDRFHLRKFGRPIINDTYFALNYGPVASNTKDLVENTSFLSEEEQYYRNKYIDNVDKYLYRSLDVVDEEVFSKTDLEAMKLVFEEFGGYDQFHLSKESHKYPEWKKFEGHLKSSSSSRFEMNYEDFFSAYQKGDSLLFDKSQEYLEESKELFLENGYIYRLV